VKDRRRKVGLYVVSKSAPLPFDEWLRERGGARAPNAQAALAQWFDQVDKWSADVVRAHRGSSHAKLARPIRAELDFVRRLVESVDSQTDRHFVVAEAMRLMRAVRDLEHNLALSQNVEGKRRSLASLPKARRSKKPPRRYTRQQLSEALAAANGKKYVAAKALGCDVKTFRKYLRLQS
jgi:hypothetical protein